MNYIEVMDELGLSINSVSPSIKKKVNEYESAKKVIESFDLDSVDEADKDKASKAYQKAVDYALGLETVLEKKIRDYHNNKDVYKERARLMREKSGQKEAVNEVKEEVPVVHQGDWSVVGIVNSVEGADFDKEEEAGVNYSDLYKQPHEEGALVESNFEEKVIVYYDKIAQEESVITDAVNEKDAVANIEPGVTYQEEKERVVNNAVEQEASDFNINSKETVVADNNSAEKSKVHNEAVDTGGEELRNEGYYQEEQSAPKPEYSVFDDKLKAAHSAPSKKKGLFFLIAAAGLALLTYGTVNIIKDK